MERPHSQLCTWLTDRLSSNNTNGFAHIHLMTATEIPTVAGRTNPVASLTSNRRAHQNLIDAHLFNLKIPQLIHQRTRRHEHFISAGLDNIGSDDATQHTIRQRLNNVATIDHRRHHKTSLSTTVGFNHHHVLCHVNKTSRQIT